MEKTFDYSIVPAGFMHCIHAQCLRSKECLRHLVMLHVTAGPEKLSVVNPANVSLDGKDCRFFFPDTPTKFALGITHLLENIPYNKIAVIKYSLYEYFSKGTYYRISKKQRLITPTEQNYIRQLFLDQGIEEEPAFDKYIEKYNW